jgi:hypothetical protein
VPALLLLPLVPLALLLALYVMAMPPETGMRWMRFAMGRMVVTIVPAVTVVVVALLVVVVPAGAVVLVPGMMLAALAALIALYTLLFTHTVNLVSCSITVRYCWLYQKPHTKRVTRFQRKVKKDAAKG